ncbi:transcription termination factor 1-like isoform X3 [Lethenteron reissneri]|uniref:transcription termination factor 1-like isoform X3 n=1 Tax=Lethenteron reissneri TaxID=7753 RepID=UPI002AB783AE|nr:transcription termination factor 1-like isoform X3 [Lethenteron reissneri]
MEMKKHEEKCQRKRDAHGNESSCLEEAPNDVDLDQVKICKKKRCVNHRETSRSVDAQTKTSDGDSRCDSFRVAKDGGEHHCKHGERREGESRRRSEEEATVAPQRGEDVRACSRSGDAECKGVKRKKKMENADDNLTPTWQQEEGALQSDREEETAKSEKKSGRKRKRTAADGGSNLEDIEPPPVQERPRKKRKRREMSIAMPDRHASSEGTVVSESCPMESPVNPEPSSSSNRKKNKKAKSCQSGNNQGGVIAQNTAGTRSKKHGKKKKRRDLQEGLPSEQLPTLRTENSVTNEHRQINASHTEEVVDEVDKEMGDEEEEEVRHLENYDYQVKFMSKFVPGLSRRLKMDIDRALKYDYHRFKEFEKEGIKVRFGRFSKVEVEQLHMNVRDFIRDHDAFTDPQKLFLPSYFPAEKTLITKYRLQNNFYNYLIRGISRPMKQIFQRGITLYEGQDLKSGRYSEEELKQLTQLTRKFGPHWTRISQIMQRGQKKLAVKFSLMNDGSAKGVWSDGEVESLLQAMKDYLQAQQQHNGVDQLNTDSEHTIRILQRFLYSEIPWRHISARVDTRNSHQCREKCLYNLEVEDSADIDWDGIVQKMKIPPWLLQRKLYQLKLFHVPNWKNKTFGEIIDVLHDIYLPRLLKKHDIGQLSAEVEPTEVLLKHLLNGID